MYKYALTLIYRLGSFSMTLMAPALSARYSVVYKINFLKIYKARKDIFSHI